MSAGGRIGVWQAPSTIVVVLVLDHERGLGLASTEIPRVSIEGTSNALGESFSRTRTTTRTINQQIWHAPLLVHLVIPQSSRFVYTLTRICSVEYTRRVESVFDIIAEPNRRAILSVLVSSQQSVGEIERRLRMPQPTVSKHLRVLREAGFVESTVDAQRRLYRLKPEPLQEVDAWLAPFRRFWSAHVDALERHLDRMDQSTRTKRKRGETK